jgi:uncharacterized protein YbjT (DUF2867 family)
MTYVVAGVSGNVGSVVADTLLSQGQKVRVVVRDRAKAQRFVDRGAEVAIADLADSAGLAKALEGAKGAFLLIPPDMSIADYRAHQRKMADSIVTAVETAKVPHLVFLSSVAAQHESGTGPIAGLHYAEQKLGALKITKSTFLRAAYFMENLGSALGTVEQGFIGSFFPADFAFDMIATVDIGKLAAQLLVEGAKTSTVVQLGGGRYSMNDIAAALSRTVGKPIKVQEAPLAAMAQALEGYGMQPELARLYQEMTGALLSGHVAFEAGHRQVTGATPVARVLEGLLGR